MSTTTDGPPPGAAASCFWTDAGAYVLDAWQRSVLFWDAVRQRGDLYLEHRRAGKPAVLRFPYERKSLAMSLTWRTSAAFPAPVARRSLRHSTRRSACLKALAAARSSFRRAPIIWAPMLRAFT